MTTAESRLNTLEVVFSPSAPITKARFFFGRYSYLTEVVDAINERGQHIVVYGERGVGKTSFSNNAATGINGLFPVKVTCNRKDGFRRLWDKAFQRVKFEQKHKGMGFVPLEHAEMLQLDLFLPAEDKISPLDIQFVLERVEIPLLFVFDEFDMIEDSSVVTEMADTIKNLSDNASHITIMLVGVGTTITDLIGEHESISRCLRQIQLPRMSGEELTEILQHGATEAGLTFTSNTSNSIVRFSQGFPHFTHLLGKHACRAAISGGSTVVTPFHLDSSIRSSAERVDESVRSLYQRATMTAKDTTRFRSVVWACADATEDEHSTFKASEIAAAYSILTGKHVRANQIAYYISELCSENRGSVLEKLGSSNNVRYRFKNPLLRAYIQLKRMSLTSGI